MNMQISVYIQNAEYHRVQYTKIKLIITTIQHFCRAGHIIYLQDEKEDSKEGATTIYDNVTLSIYCSGRNKSGTNTRLHLKTHQCCFSLERIADKGRYC